MGIYQEMVDLDQSFRNTPGIVVNDLDVATTEQREFLDRLIRMQYSAETISTVPQCDCGATNQGFNLGVICKECGTPVTDVFDQKIAPIAWIRAPIGVPAFIHPTILRMLRDALVCGAGRESSKFPYFSYLINPAIQAKTQYERMVAQVLENHGLKRGYINFINNFDEYINKLFLEVKIPTLTSGSKPTIKPTKTINLKAKAFTYLQPLFPDVPSGKVHPVHAMIRLYRSLALVQYLPLPNKVLLVLEKTHYGTYADAPVTELIDTVRTIVGIDTPLSRSINSIDTNLTGLSDINVGTQGQEWLSLRQVERRVVTTLFKLDDYHTSNKRDVVSRKEGLCRKHLYGTRVSWSARCVISSITEPHRYDELFMPWSAAVTLFSKHLENKLYKLGYSPNECKELLQGHTYKHHPLIRKLFDELLSEAPNGRIPVFIVRNPSLARSSTQLMYISKIKDDPQDVTIGLPITNVVGFNADFDGDQMNIFLPLDNILARAMKHLEPHKSFYEINGYRELSSMMAFPKPVALTIANWYRYDDSVPDEQSEQFLDSLSV